MKHTIYLLGFLLLGSGLLFAQTDDDYDNEKNEDVKVDIQAETDTKAQAKERSRYQYKEMQTLAGSPCRSFGAYVGLSGKVSQLNGEDAVFTGGQFAFVINRAVNFGVEGYLLASDIRSNYVDEFGNDDYFIEMSYGGFHIEPVFFSHKLVHFTTPILFGGGAAGVTDSRVWDDNYTGDYEEWDWFWAVEPGITAEINILRAMRLGVGASYRYIGDASLTNTTQSDLSGFAGSITLKFGWF